MQTIQKAAASIIMDILTWPETSCWDELTKQIPGVTFYHTPRWHDIITRTYPDYETATHEFVFDDGCRAAVPLIKTGEKGFLKKTARFKSSVFGLYGGILSEEGSLSAAHAENIYAHLKRTGARIRLTTNPFSPAPLPEAAAADEHFTQVLSLSGADNFYSKLSRGGKSNLKQARKKGVTVRCSTNETDVSAYYGLYRDTLERWGDKTLQIYPESLFVNIMNMAGDAAGLWLADIEDTVVAGVVVFYWNKIASYWHGASLRDYFSCYPNNMLHMAIIEDAAQRGFSYYDFGPSGGQEGVVRFKKSFGAEQKPFYSLKLP
jgi:hypothetical protein